MTRFSTTVVVVDDVEVDVDDVDVVDVVEEVGDVVEAAVVSTGAVEVVTGDVDVPSVAAGDDAVVLESEEHARTSCDARSSAHHDDLCITRREDSA